MQAFRELYERGFSGWELFLVGGVRAENPAYLNLVREHRYWVTHHNSAECSILGIEEPVIGKQACIGMRPASVKIRHSALTEWSILAFTPVEAMSAGCVPVVYGAGGLPETVVQGQSGFLWRDVAELKEFTLQLAADQGIRSDMSKQAVERSERFNRQRFCHEIETLLA